MRKTIYIAFAALLVSQILLLLKTIEFANGNFTGYIIETVVLIFLAGLFLVGYAWAKWSLILFVGLLLIVSVIGGVQHADFVFYLIALLQAFALYHIVISLKAGKV
jgi:hypothetical protein